MTPDEIAQVRERINERLKIMENGDNSGHVNPVNSKGGRSYAPELILAIVVLVIVFIVKGW